MTKNKVILFIGGDRRQVWAARAMTDLGRVFAMGIAAAERVTALDRLDALKEKADILVLPLFKEKEPYVRLSRSIVSFRELLPVLNDGALVFGGLMSEAQTELFRDAGFRVFDYFKDEALTIKNCIPTAEGSLQIAMTETARTISGSSVLITGFGRVAKACVRTFGGVGARCTVSARRRDALAEAECIGCRTVPLAGIDTVIPEADIIINTVPAMIFDTGRLSLAGKDTVFIDLASKPGGIDLEQAVRLNKRAVFAPGLPGKAAPITAGEIIAETIKNMVQRREASDDKRA